MKVLWFDATTGKIVPYTKDNSDVVNKWLLWNNVDGEDIIIAGPKCYQCETHKVLRGHFDGQVPARNPDGAGSCSGGFVYFWDSSGYNIDTKHGDKPKVLEALGVEE